MGFSHYPIITDELLSAYIDNAVNDDERAAVEAAIANDLEIAWRVESLRSTVSLLGQLTDVPLPRSFTLDEALLEMGASSDLSRQAPPHPHSTGSSSSFWNNWLDFWRSGNMAWRNAAAVCALLLLVFLVSDFAVVNEMPIAQDATVSVARNNPAADSTRVVNDDEIAPAAVAMASKSVAQVEEQTVPEPMASENDVESDGESVEAEAMQSAALAMNSEQGAAEEIVLPPEGPTDNESPGDSADEADQADVAVADEPGQAEALTDEALSAAPMMLSAASVDAGEAMTESALPTGADAEVAPSSEIVEPMMAAAAVAEPVSDAASPIETEAQPRAMMLADAEGVETDVADEEAAETGGQDAALPETEQLAAASTQVNAPQAEADATQVSEPVSAEVAVQQAPQSDAGPKAEPEVARPSAVAMVDSAEQSAMAKSRPLSSENTAELASMPAEESVSNSAQLFSIAQILLATLALIFFILWLRSRSQSATTSS